MKTNELTGAALDWAVAKCEGMLDEPWLWGDESEVLSRYKFSSNWAQGGPIIEREGIDLEFYELPERGWMAGIINKAQAHGPTPLIAAMRCYVASKLGDEVEIPEELK